MNGELSLREASQKLFNELKVCIPKAGCSYKNYWIIATYPKGRSKDETYPDGLFAVDKRTGNIEVFNEQFDMEGFQQAIKSAIDLS